ncbi:MAG TPA: hypothetical protein VF559_02820 [Caulobacteraceae bacterium]
MSKGEGGPQKPQCARETGSVLIEALVALAIVAMLMGVTYQAVGGSAVRARGAEARRAAVLVAQSALSGVGSATPLTPGRNSGIDGDMVWQVDVAPYRTGFAGSTAGALYAVSATVRRRDDPRVLAALQTLRVGPA